MNQNTWIMIAAILLLGLIGGFFLRPLILPYPTEKIVVHKDSLIVRHDTLKLETVRTITSWRVRTLHDTLSDTVEVFRFDTLSDIPVEIEIRSDSGLIAKQRDTTRVRMWGEFWQKDDLFKNLGLYVYPLWVRTDRKEHVFVEAAPGESWFQPWMNFTAGHGERTIFEIQGGINHYNIGVMLQDGPPTFLLGYKLGR